MFDLVSEEALQNIGLGALSMAIRFSCVCKSSSSSDSSSLSVNLPFAFTWYVPRFQARLRLVSSLSSSSSSCCLACWYSALADWNCAGGAGTSSTVGSLRRTTLCRLTSSGFYAFIHTSLTTRQKSQQRHGSIFGFYLKMNSERTSCWKYLSKVLRLQAYSEQN